MNKAEYWIIRNASEKRAKAWQRRGERTNFVTFALWCDKAMGIKDPSKLSQRDRNALYVEYMGDMISMGFFEWERAKSCGVSPFYDPYDPNN